MRSAALIILSLFVLSGCLPATRPAAGDGCDRILLHHRAGDHMLAIEAGRSLGSSITTCSPETNAALSSSYTIVNKADSFVRTALAERRKGNLVAARERLQSALRVYPRYYWVQKLARGVDRSILARVNELDQEARYYEARDNLQEASLRIRQALILTPDDEALATRLKALDDRIDFESSKAAAKDGLRHVRELLDAGRFDEAEDALQSGTVQNFFPEKVREIVVTIREHRSVAVQGLLDRARVEAGRGNDEEAMHLIELGIDAGPVGQSLTDDIVGFAKQLGMSLYAQGKLRRCREVWLLALGADPDNESLLEYLEQVQTRLDRLEKIQAEQETEDGEVPALEEGLLRQANP